MSHELDFGSRQFKNRSQKIRVQLHANIFFCCIAMTDLGRGVMFFSKNGPALQDFSVRSEVNQ